jgi:hypothetical protein
VAETRIRILKDRLESLKDLSISPPQLPPKHILRPKASTLSSSAGDRDKDRSEDDIDYRTASHLSIGLVRTLFSLPDEVSPDNPWSYNPVLPSPPTDRQPEHPPWPNLDLPPILTSNDDLHLLRLTTFQRLTILLRGNTRMRYEVDTNLLMPGYCQIFSVEIFS